MYHFFLCSVCALVLGVAALAQNAVAVQITNIRSNQGTCKVCLFDNPAAFSGKGAAYQCVQAPVKNKTAQARFTNIPAGSYAIAVFHDANNNDKLDVNFLGIPKEGYGASRNRLPFASAPEFEDNQFSVGEKSTMQLVIRLRNL